MHVYVDKEVSLSGEEIWVINGFDAVEKSRLITRQLLGQNREQSRKYSNRIILPYKHHNRTFGYKTRINVFDVPGYKGADCEAYAVALHTVVKKVRAWFAACDELDSKQGVIEKAKPGKTTTVVTDKNISTKKSNNC